MNLIFSPVALKALRKVPAKEAAILLAILKEIAADPFAPHVKAEKLTDHPGFRARQGDWRAVYRLDRQSGEMIVDLIAHRSEVYK